MGRARWSFGLALAGVLLVATQAAARSGEAQPRLDVDRPLEVQLVPWRYAEWPESPAAAGGTQTITLTPVSYTHLTLPTNREV